MEKFVGSKYDGYISSDELEKLITNDVNEAIKKGEVPPIRFTIRKKSFAGGRSITLTVKKILQKTLDQSSLTNELKKKLKEIGEAYNMTESDMQSDYYSTSYFFDVEFDLNE